MIFWGGTLAGHENVKRLIDPQPLSPLVKRIIKAPRALTARIRVLPDFLVIGAQRSGTTSLQRYLIQHPCIAAAFRKEVHFFDRNLRKDITWYREHFPSRIYKYYVTTILRRQFMTGEATASYLFYPHAPRLISETLPGIKLIALLRNPVDRAYSHYQHEVGLKYETLSFDDAINQEPQRLDGERERIVADKRYDSYNYDHYSYLSRGLYVDQLKDWMALFPKEQMLILRSEDFFAEPGRILQQVFQFLELPAWALPQYKPYNAREYTTMDAATRNRLSRYFEPHNRRLHDLLGRDFAWN
jgi:hypothetical protein